MKAAIKAMLRTVGLAPARQVDRLERDARHATERTAELEERLAKVRADVEEWKRRYEDSVNAAAEWKQAATLAGGKAERASADAQRAEARVADLKASSERLNAKVRAMWEQLDKANRAATGAREHLMATEVKLDLIEAAIQVLDSRTRENVVARS